MKVTNIRFTDSIPEDTHNKILGRSICKRILNATFADKCK
jgi:hypothetical protein